MRHLLNNAVLGRYRRTIETLWRFYSVSALNTLFGYSTYAALIALGVNLFTAQILAQLIGMTFNFFTYGKHVFREHDASISRYIAVYAGNYLFNLLLLWAFHHLTSSDYLAGLLAVIVSSLVNLVLLKRIVYRPR